MDPIKELQGLKKDADLLERNTTDDHDAAKGIIFKDPDLAKKQIRRILGRTWALKEARGWSTANDAAVQLFLFATDSWAMLGSYSPEDWSYFSTHVEDQCVVLMEWADRRLAEYQQEGRLE